MFYHSTVLPTLDCLCVRAEEFKNGYLRLGIMKHVTNTKLPAGIAIVILDVPPYGRVKIGDNKKTAFPQLDKIIRDLFRQVGCASEDGYPAVNVANLLVERFGADITMIESADNKLIVF